MKEKEDNEEGAKEGHKHHKNAKTGIKNIIFFRRGN